MENLTIYSDKFDCNWVMQSLGIYLFDYKPQNAPFQDGGFWQLQSVKGTFLSSLMLQSF